MATTERELLLSKEALRELIQSILERKVPFRIMATGCSMSPIIRSGDIIVISPLLNEMPRCGDIVAFISPAGEAVTVHRIVWKKGGNYFIRGDNMLKETDIVPEERILGRVTNVERKGKKVRFGLGGERVVIGFLNRTRIFSFLNQAGRRILGLVRGGRGS